MSCSTTISALVLLISPTSSAVRATSLSVMPAAGSSSSTSSGSVESTTPSSTHCRCPWASWPTMREATAVSPTRSSMSSTTARARAPLFVRAAASHRFSRTVSPLKTLGTWVLMPTPSRAISCGSAREMSWPRNRTVPEVGMKLSGQQLEERALAGSVRADQAAQLAVRRARNPPPAPPARRRSACRGRESRSAARSSRRLRAVGRRRGPRQDRRSTARRLSGQKNKADQNGAQNERDVAEERSSTPFAPLGGFAPSAAVSH